MNFLELAAKLSLDSSDYERGLGKAKGLATSVGKGIGKAMKVGAMAVGAASAAMVAFGASSVKTGMDFDKSMSQVAATMGKTMEEMENEVGSTTVRINGQMKEFNGTLRDFAQYMGANTAFTATQAADALNYMALAGYDAQTSMNMLPNVLNLAAAGSMDLARASDMVTDTQTAFGITLERTSQMVDEMAKAASTGNTSVEQLGDAFLTVGGLAQEMNGGFVTLKDGTKVAVDGVQELEIMLTAMANAGIKGSEAGTHVRNMLLKLSSPTDAGTKQLEALGVAVFDAEGNMRSMKDIMGDLSGALGDLTQEEKIQAISDLFNTRDLASAEALLNAVGEDWDKIGRKILKADGAAAQMAETQLYNLAGDITILKSAFEGLQIAISDNVAPKFRGFVKLATKGLSQVTEAIKKNDFKGAMKSIGRVISEGLTMISTGLPKAIEAGHELLSSIAEGLMESMPEIADAAVTVVSTFLQNIIGRLPDFFASGGQILLTLGQGILDALPEIRASVKQAIESIAEMSRDPEALNQMLKVGLDILLEIGKGITENIDSIAETVGNIIGSICDFLAEHFDELVDAAVDILTSLGKALADNVGKLAPKVGEVIGAIVDSLSDPDNLADMATAAVEILAALATALIDSVATLVDKAPEIIDNLVTGICNAASGDPGMDEAGTTIIKSLIKAIMNLQEKIWQLGEDIVKGLVFGIKTEGGKKLKPAGEGMLSKVGEGIKNSTAPNSWGEDLVIGFVNGMNSRKGLLEGAASSIASTIKGYIHFSEPDVGPLSNFHTYAPDMMRLFAEGITENKHIVADAVEDAFDFRDKFEYHTITTGDYADAGLRADSELMQLLRDIRDNMDTDLVLDDGTVIGWMDKALGRRAMQRGRGNA